MNKERIDSLFEVLNFGDVDEYKMYQEIQAFFSMEGYNGETLSNFMQDIEKSGLIDYFLSKAEENKKNKYIRGALCMLYVFISDDTILDKLIENPKKYGLEQYEITELIDKVKDMTLLKKYSENYNNYGLSVMNAGNLLERIGDVRIYKRMDRKLERRQKKK